MEDHEIHYKLVVFHFHVSESEGNYTSMSYHVLTLVLARGLCNHSFSLREALVNS